MRDWFRSPPTPGRGRFDSVPALYAELAGGPLQYLRYGRNRRVSMTVRLDSDVCKAETIQHIYYGGYKVVDKYPAELAVRRDIWARLMDEVTELEDTQFEQSDDKHTTNVSADWPHIENEALPLTSLQGDDILLLAFCFCMTFDVFKEVFPIKALLAVKVYDEALCDSDELDLLFHGPIGGPTPRQMPPTGSYKISSKTYMKKQLMKNSAMALLGFKEGVHKDDGTVQPESISQRLAEASSSKDVS